MIETQTSWIDDREYAVNGDVAELIQFLTGATEWVPCAKIERNLGWSGRRRRLARGASKGMVIAGGEGYLLNDNASKAQYLEAEGRKQSQVDKERQDLIDMKRERHSMRVQHHA